MSFPFLTRYFLGLAAVILTTGFCATSVQAGVIVQAPTYLGLDRGLVGFWSFDGKTVAGTHVYDASGNGNRGVMTNGPKLVTGKIGQGLQFDGVNDYVALPNSSSLEITAEITLTAWVNPRASDQQDRIVTKRNNSGAADYALHCRNGTNRCFVEFRAGDCSANTTEFGTEANSPVPLGRWTHVAATFKDSTDTVRIYINGQETESTSTFTRTICVTGNAAEIGGQTGNTRWFDGVMDDVRVYNRVLSSDEIKRLYKIGATAKVNTTLDGPQSGLVGWWTFDGKDMSGNHAYDASGNGNRGTLNTSTVTQTFSTNASTTFMVPADAGSVTIETWGAGGEGGVGLSTTDGGGGGGGGGYAKSIISAAGQTLTLSIGKGGAGATDKRGQTGGDSYVANSGGTILVKACGGQGGGASADNGNGGGLGGAGGTTACGTGDTEFAGGDGGKGEDGSDGDGAGGGEGACDNGSGATAADQPTGNNSGGAGGSGGCAGTGGGDGGAGGNNGADGSNGSSVGGGGGGAGEGTSRSGGNGADGQIKLTYLMPDPQRIAGKIGQGLQFDGVDDGVNAGSAASLDNTMQTISAWIYPRSGGKAIDANEKRGTIGAKVDFYSPGVGYIFYVRDRVNAPRRLGFRHACNTTNLVRESVDDTIDFHTWQHVVLTWDRSASASNVRIYKNGVEVSYTALIQTDCAGGLVIDQARNFTIGGELVNSSAIFDGFIDDVRFYNRALSQDEIKRLYKSGSTARVNTTITTGSLEKGLVGHWSFDGGDMSGNTAFDRGTDSNDNKGTFPTDGTTHPSRAPGKIGQGLDFNGISGRVDINNAAGMHTASVPFTVTFWMNARSLGEASLGHILSAQISGGHNQRFWVGATNALFATGDGSSTSCSTSNNAFGFHQWHFVAYVNDRSNGNIVHKIYVDGVDKISDTTCSITGSANPTTWDIGNFGTDSDARTFDGRLDDMRFYNRVLSTDEIKRLYNVGR